MLKNKLAKIVVVAAIASLSIIGVLTLNHDDEQKNNNSSNTTNPSSHEVKSEFDSIMHEIENDTARLIDVRTRQEYENRKIAGAELLSLQDIESGVRPEYDDSTKLYIYCRSGNRSAVAASILKADGYNVEDLGGLEDVAAIGGKIARQ